MKNAYLSFLLSFFLLGCSQSDFEKQNKMLLEYMKQHPMQGDYIFLFNQARLVSGERPVSFDISDVERRNPNRQGPEWLLLQYQNINIHALLPDIEITEDADFSEARAQRFIEGDYSFDERFSEEYGYVTYVMHKAANCTSYDAGDIDLGVPSYEYVSTHQLLALILSYLEGCVSREDYREMASLYSSRVYNELVYASTAGMTDIQIERMAVLCMARLCDWVSRTLVDDLLFSRNRRTGLWEVDDKFVPDYISYLHSSVLAYYVLAAKRFR